MKHFYKKKFLTKLCRTLNFLKIVRFVSPLFLRRISGDDGADPTEFGLAWLVDVDDAACLDEDVPESAETGIRVKCSNGILICDCLRNEEINFLM